MEFSIINVALHYGADMSGTEKAPAILEPYVHKILTQNGHIIREQKYIDEPELSPDGKYKGSATMKWTLPVCTITDKVMAAVDSAINQGLIPLTIGGDHSVGLGTGKASINAYEDLLIIWLDAHADMNTGETSPSGNLHGMPLAAVMGKSDRVLQSGLKHPISPRNILLLGARSIDPGENTLISKAGITHISSATIMGHGVERALKEIHELIESLGIKNIHLSIDIDVLDPDIAPGTGVPEKGGLDIAHACGLVEGIINTGLVRVIDFVEYNPDMDRDNITLKNCCRILDAIPGPVS